MLNKILSLTISNTILLAISAVLFWGLYFSPLPKPKPFGDDIFNTEAWIISDVIKGNKPVDSIKLDHTPLGSIYYVIPALISPSSPTSPIYYRNAIIWNFIFFMLSTWLYIQAFRKLFNNKGLLIFMLLYFLPPVNIYYHIGFQTEPLAYFFVGAIAWYCSNRQLSSNLNYSKYDNLLVGLLISLLITIRPNAIFLIPLILLFSLLFKKKSLFIIGSISSVFFVGITLLTSTIKSNNDTSKDSVVFLLEQIHVGQFFLRHEPTDWSFFNNEYRPSSRDYNELQESRSKIHSTIQSGTPPRSAYIKEITDQYKQYPIASLLHPLTKFIHGHSFHIGTTIPGELNINYIQKYPKYFIVNTLLKIFVWTIIIAAFLFLIQHRKELFTYWFLWLPWLSFAIFDMISASEQRYLFPARNLILMLAVGYLLSKFFFSPRKLSNNFGSPI